MCNAPFFLLLLFKMNKGAKSGARLNRPSQLGTYPRGLSEVTYFTQSTSTYPAGGEPGIKVNTRCNSWRPLSDSSTGLTFRKEPSRVTSPAETSVINTHLHSTGLIQSDERVRALNGRFFLARARELRRSSLSAARAWGGRGELDRRHTRF